MKALALAVAVAWSGPAWADSEPPRPPVGQHHIPLKAGEPAPADGVFAPPDVYRFDVERLLYLEQVRLACMQDRQAADGFRATPWLIGAGFGIVIGVISTALFVKATHR